MAVKKNQPEKEPEMRRPFDDEVRDPYEEDNLRDPWQPQANPSGPVDKPDRSKAEKKAAEEHRKVTELEADSPVTGDGFEEGHPKPRKKS